MPARPLLSPWPARLAYAAALLAVVWFFQHKMAEQARLHRMLTEVAPLAVEVVEEGNTHYLKGFLDGVEAYPTDFLNRERSQVLRFLELSGENSGSLHLAVEESDESHRYRLFRVILDNLPVLGDSLWHYRYANTWDQPNIKAILPTFPEKEQNDLAGYFVGLSRLEADQLANLLQLRISLGKSMLLQGKYQESRAGDRFDPFQPGFIPKQVCPKVGELFEADAYWATFGYYKRPHRATINGKEYPIREGSVRFRHQFATPGQHRLVVEFEIENTQDSTQIITCSRDFVVTVAPK